MASLRGSLAANERWGKRPAAARIFLTEEEINWAKMAGLSEKEFAEQKSTLESLGIDLVGALKNRTPATTEKK